MASSPSALRQVGDYKAGSIQKIVLKNFLTYEHAVITPGPRYVAQVKCYRISSTLSLTPLLSLNTVVGPNGTGKSTILNAICLGLGGQPKNLGRQDDARDFVMNGKDVAKITIHLTQQDLSVIKFTRVIDRNKGSEKGRGRGASTFGINGQQATLPQVQAEVQKLNIAIDNLCTFLPQDKVGSFSGFNPQQLLLETEKTLSANAHLYHTHLELIEQEKKLGVEQNDVETLQNKLDKLQKENEEFEREKERFEERTKALQQAELLRKKLLWLECDALHDQLEVKKLQKKEIKTRIVELRQRQEPLQRAVDEAASECKSQDHLLRESNSKIASLKSEIEKQTTKSLQHGDQVDSLVAEVEAAEAQRLHLRTQLDAKQSKVDEYQGHLDATDKSLDDLTREVKETSDKHKEATKRYEIAKKQASKLRAQFEGHERTAKAAQARLAKMKDSKTERAKRYFRQVPNADRICDWVEKNRSLFRKGVWGPIAVEAAPQNAEIAAYLEQHTPNFILKAFVCERKEDADLLYAEVRGKLKLPINVLTVNTDATPSHHRRQYSPQKFQILQDEYGIKGYLDSFVDAPSAVLEALCVNAKIHDVLVGGMATQQAIDRKNLLQYLHEPDQDLQGHKPANSAVFANDGREYAKYMTSISRYSGKPSTRIDSVNGQCRLLSTGVDMSKKAEAELLLKESHEGMNQARPELSLLEGKVKALEAEGQTTQFAKSNAERVYGNYKKMESKLKGAQKSVTTLRKQLEQDASAEKKRKVEEIMRRIKNSLKSLKQCAVAQKGMMEATLASSGSNITKNALLTAERKAK